MKIKLILILSILYINNIFAHHDKRIYKKYGNVIVYLRTGFDYSDINKIQIIGKLSEELTKNLKYKDTLFIEYIQDYTSKYLDNVYFLENNNSNYRFIKGIEGENDIASTKKGISVRIYANKIDILNVLKLVEYAIINKNEINKHLSKQKVRYKDFFDKKHFKTKCNSKGFIETIFKKETSKLLKKITERKIVVENKKDYGIEIYWKNNEFLFEYKYLKGLKKANKLFFKIKDYYYHIDIGYGNRMLVFIDKTHFYYIDPSNKLGNKQNEFKSGTYVPALVIGKFENKLLIFNYYGSSDLNMYLIKQNKMINEFK